MADPRPLQVSLEFVGGASGPSYSVPRLSAELRQIGVVSNLAGLLWPHMPQPGDTAYERAFRPSPFLRARGASMGMRRHIDESIACGSTNLLHCHSVWLMPPTYCARTARKRACPFVLSPRGTLSEWAFRRGSPMKRVIWPLFQRACVDAATCLHATSEQEASEIRKHGFRQPIAVIPNGVDIPLEAAKLEEREPIVAFMGRLHPKKGLDDLLAAWASVAADRPAWRLVIAGPIDSEYARTLVERVDKERIPRTSFVGEVHADAKATLLRTASLFVLPTYSENFGIAVAEALAAGTPVAVSRGAPWSEVEPNGCGWWHPIGPEGALEALASATARPITELHAMGLRGRALVAERYGWRGVAHRMSRVYEWLLNGGTRPDSVS